MSKKYVFAQKDGEDFSCIKLIEKKYKNVVYKYNNVKLAPNENDDGRLPLKFTYDVFQNPNKVDVESEEFRQYIGDILVELMEEQLKNCTIKFE